jgi:hypothetical protein
MDGANIVGEQPTQMRVWKSPIWDIYATGIIDAHRATHTRFTETVKP